MGPSSNRPAFGRRAFLTGGAAAAAGLAVGSASSALGGGPVGAVTNGPGRNGISTAKPRSGGQLVFGTDAEEQGFLPTSARFDEVGVMYARTVFDPLAIITASGGYAPYLAQSITPNSEYTSWTVTLRPNLRFHDGTSCDGAALLQNFKAHQSSALLGPVITPILENFAQTGPLSVQANFKSPWVAFPYYLAGGIGGQIAYPVAPAMLANPNGTDHPIGTGPFVYDSWVPNEHFTATRNHNYWRSGLPHLDSITYRPIPDAESRSEALQSGSVDIIVNVTPQVTVQYRGNRQWSYTDDSGALVGEPDVNCLLINTAAGPLANPKLRLACAKALDRTAYSKIIDAGVEAPINGPFVPGTPYFATSGYPSYDPGGATRLVHEISQQTGKPVAFTIGYASTPSTLRALQYIQQKYQQAGMQVSLSPFQQNDLIDKALTGQYEALVWRQFGAVEPDLNYIFWSTTTVAPVGGFALNMTRNDNPSIEAALVAGREAINTNARAQAYQHVARLFAQDLPYLWQDRTVWMVAAQPKVQNWNNPTTPSGQKAYGMITGSIWPTQIWLS